MSQLVPVVTAEVIAIVPRPALWLRVAAWWPSAIGLMVGAALVAGALR